MMRLCCRYVKTNELAQEALNLGFLKVFQSIETFDIQKGELGGWIRTIMIRTCIDLARKEVKYIADESLIKETDDVFISPEVLNKLYAEDLLLNIRRLPAATQMVFNLSVIDGYTHKEIGEKLNISESTSRWHLTEAKKQLRTLLTAPQQGVDYPTEKIKKIR